MNETNSRDPAVAHGQTSRLPMLLWLVGRLLLTCWAAAVVGLNPVPAAPDETVRPYLGAEIINEGPAGLLLGPWQRFDTNRYVRIARDGYAAEEDSVFPPLYPWLMRAVRYLVPAGSADRALLIAGLLISNLAGAGAFILFYRLSREKIGSSAARRALVYLAVFPTAFYLFAGYTEPLFLLLALACFQALENGNAWQAGLFALLATLTRTAGIALALPLAFAVWESWRGGKRAPWNLIRAGGPALLPAAGLLAFLAYRASLGLPPLAAVYESTWFQNAGFPGHDLITALRMLLTGQGERAGEFTLWLDLAAGLLLLAVVPLTTRRYGWRYGLFVAAMVAFVLLPRSDLKPLFSFTRYALVVFPLFWWWGESGANPWLNRLILYPSLLLLLYLSGQFFIWGWVA